MEIQGLSEAWNTLEKEIKQIKQIYICLKSQLHDLNVERNLNTSGKDTDNNIDNNILPKLCFHIQCLVIPEEQAF